MSNAAITSVTSFIHDLRFSAVPAQVQHQARRCLIDTLGVALAGTELPIASIVRRFAARHLAAGEGYGARLIQDGRRVSVPGAAMAGAAIIDGYDAHDGHVLCKGHVGVIAIPTAMAFADALSSQDWDEFLALMLIGYEIGTRAGIVLHATAPICHSSGAWNALGAAAIGARALRLTLDQTRHTLGIAEYYGPRSPLMRVVAHPTMLKDGSTMGAFAGAAAAYLAADGFTGAPVETIDLLGPAHRDCWTDVGTRWRILEQYAKPTPVCRWTQPAAEAVMALRQDNPGLHHEQVRTVAVETFHEAVSLSCREPSETDAAQYSLPFVVAAALVHGRLTPDEIAGAGLHDADVIRLSKSMVLQEDEAFNARFPAERWARVRLILTDGTELASGPYTTVGDPSTPLSDAALEAKFLVNAGAALDEGASKRALALAKGEPGSGRLQDLLDLIALPATGSGATTNVAQAQTRIQVWGL